MDVHSAQMSGGHRRYTDQKVSPRPSYISISLLYLINPFFLFQESRLGSSPYLIVYTKRHYNAASWISASRMQRSVVHCATPNITEMASQPDQAFSIHPPFSFLCPTQQDRTVIASFLFSSRDGLITCRPQPPIYERVWSYPISPFYMHLFIGRVGLTHDRSYRPSTHAHTHFEPKSLLSATPYIPYRRPQDDENVSSYPMSLSLRCSAQKT